MVGHIFHLFSNINGHPYQQIFANIPLFELLQKFLLKKYQMKMGVKFNFVLGVYQQQQNLPMVQIWNKSKDAFFKGETDYQLAINLPVIY